jgi:glycosyltransferase involved in cell wall biosynthesis
MLDRITPLILTFNEAPNIRRTLEMLDWAKDIVVVDSMSTDETVTIASEHRNVRLFRRPFDTHATQWNYGLNETDISTDWVLALDADYVLSLQLVAELRSLNPEPSVAGFRTPFSYHVAGVPLRGSVYPPVTTLFRRSLARYEQDGHTQRVVVEGHVDVLTGCINHDDRKSLARWLAAQDRYMKLEAAKLRSTAFKKLSWADRLRLLILPAPPVMFLFCAIVKGTIFDGKPGLYYSLQRAVAEALLSLHLLELLMASDRTVSGRSS